MERERPIGWYVRRLDGLLEQVVEHAVAAEGLTRRHWQVLADAAEGGGTGAAALAPFEGADAARADLVRRGWLEEHDDGVRMTDAGRGAHRRLLGSVTDVRRAVTEGLGAEEYRQAVAALARMVAAAERLLAADSPTRRSSPGHGADPSGV